MSAASATPETVRVSPGRLASGRWCHQTHRQQGEGDISASYSADRIAMQGRVRAPFRLQGWPCVAVSLSRNGAEAYRLVPEGAFDGEPTTYAEKVRAADGERARNDPQGFHHGMRVTHGGSAYVLSGPPIRIVPGDPEPKQANLFGQGGAS